MTTNPLSQEISEFLAEKSRRRTQATADQYSSILNGVWLPWCAEAGITDAGQMNDQALDAFVDYLRAKRNPKGKPLSVSTIHTYLKQLRVFLKWADVPRGKFEQPKKQQRLRDTLSRQEIDLLEQACTEERSRLIVRVLADCGLRVSELLGLRPQDLRANTSDRQYFIRVVGKGDKEREVGVPGPTFKRLQHFATVNAQPYIFNGKLRRANGEIGRLTPSGVQQLIRRLAHIAKISSPSRRVWPHLLRHSYATEMARKQVPMDFVRRALGHTSLAMVSEVYSHTTSADSYEAMMRALK